MKFDFVIGNPPYQEDDGGNGKSAKPVYNQFVEAAKKIEPEVLSLIIPSRWFAGGKGLNNFRNEMLNDECMCRIVDFENYRDVFPDLGGLAGGVCFFIRNRLHKGLCKVTNATSVSETTVERKLNEYNIFIRNNLAVGIVEHVQKIHQGFFLDSVVSSRKPFGLPTNYEPQKEGIPCWFIQKIGKKYAGTQDVDDSNGFLNKWKLLAPKAPIAGQTDFSKPVKIYYESNTLIAAPGECCTESYIVLGAFETEKETKNYKSYIFTKTVRYLLLQTVVSQDITKKNFCFVPSLTKYDCEYTDEILCKKWKLSEEQWNLIDSKIM